jgi:ribosomal protein S12 methylthiotransferase accessory factor
MIERPNLKPQYHAEAVVGEGLVLLSETGHVLLEGELYIAIAPYLDGRFSVDEIVDRLAGRATRAEVMGVLDHLEQEGHIAGNVESMPASEAALWASEGVDPVLAAGRLAEGRVALHAVGAVAVEPLVAALQLLRVEVGGQGSFGVVLTDDYLRSELRAYNREALRNDRPWMLVKPVGFEIWLGPVFLPGRAGCWECLAQRLRANRPVESFLCARNDRREPLPVPRAYTGATLQIACNLAASKIAEWIVRGALPELEGKIVTFDVRSLQAATHVLVWQPQCPACGDAPEDVAGPIAPIVLASRKKTFTEDGGHRVVSPEATLARHAHQVSPITGAVSTLTRIGIANDGVLHRYAAGHNFAIHRSGMRHLRNGLRSHSGGKGASDLQARASALGEALERASAVYRGDEPRIQARLKDLGADGIHPNVCMNFSARQYRLRDAWNARGSRFNFVPVTFDEDAAIEWTPVWSLTHRAPRYLPTAFCYFNYPLPDAAAFCRSCSNGNAGGNTLEEAILQGFLELVERDSVALWWYSRVRRPAVDLASFDDPYLDRLSAFLLARRRELWVLDLSSDLEIPTFAAISRRIDRQPEDLLFGFGAHLDARIAVLRAVTELNQFLVFFGDESDRNRSGRDGDSEVRHWLETATLANQPYLVPDRRTAPRLASDYPRTWSDDLRDDVLACQALIERHGMEMLVLDQTRADIGLPVVKVIVPGLRHFWARHAPGRLYDVPVRLGWLPRSLAEDELNPVAMFL